MGEMILAGKKDRAGKTTDGTDEQRSDDPVVAGAAPDAVEDAEVVEPSDESPEPPNAADDPATSEDVSPEDEEDGTSAASIAAGVAAATAAVPSVGRTTLDRHDEEEPPSGHIIRDGPPEERRFDRSTTPPPSPPPVERTVERRGGFLPLVLGGLLAGGIGWLAATMFDAQGGDERVVALESEVEALRGTLGSANDAVAAIDLTPLEASLSELTARFDAMEQGIGTPGEELIVPLRGDLDGLREELAPLGETVTGLDDAVGTLAERLASVEDRVASVSDGVDAVAGVPETVSTLSNQVESATSEVAAVGERMSGLEDRVAAMTETARDVEAEAEALAREAARNQLQIAVETGDIAYAEQLDVLGGDVPSDLADGAETGVPTLTTLQADFPPLARDALREARQTDSGEPGVRSFLARVANARSLEPREGDDPDAVLSRVEAAVREGDLETALAELQVLPTEAQAAFGDWVTRARARLQAERALDEYLDTSD